MAKHRIAKVKAANPVQLVGTEPEDTENEDALIGALVEQDERQDQPTPVALASEPLFAILLRSAIEQTSPDDIVLRDFVTLVVPEMSARLAAVTAKGGLFAEKKLAEGKSEKEVARYRADQSLRAHLVNGLLPSAHRRSSHSFYC